MCLYLEDGEWSCDCGARRSLPARRGRGHRRAPAPPRTSPSPSNRGSRGGSRLRYYRIDGERLVLERRQVVQGACRSAEPLTRLIAGQRLPEGLVPTDDDLAVDRLLGAGLLRGDQLEAVARVLRHLTQAAVTFAGQPVRVRDEPLLDAPRSSPVSSAMVLRLGAPRGLRRVVAGVALSWPTAARRASSKLCGARWERLPLERAFVSGARRGWSRGSTRARGAPARAHREPPRAADRARRAARDRVRARAGGWLPPPPARPRRAPDARVRRSAAGARRRRAARPPRGRVRSATRRASATW
ncbi:MAG: hypothetical protein MZU84_00800 [Sphingobacterium sp.]|nr:hypothetical protein [Sphingobacterium sp.]